MTANSRRLTIYTQTLHSNVVAESWNPLKSTMTEIHGSSRINLCSVHKTSRVMLQTRWHTSKLRLWHYKIMQFLPKMWKIVNIQTCKNLVHQSLSVLLHRTLCMKAGKIEQIKFDDIFNFYNINKVWQKLVSRTLCPFSLLLADLFGIFVVFSLWCVRILKIDFSRLLLPAVNQFTQIDRTDECGIQRTKPVFELGCGIPSSAAVQPSNSLFEIVASAYTKHRYSPAIAAQCLPGIAGVYFRFLESVNPNCTPSVCEQSPGNRVMRRPDRNLA